MLLSNTDGFFDAVFQLVKEKFIFLKKTRKEAGLSYNFCAG